MIGFDNDFMAIKNRMYQSSPDFKIIPIVGMGGIGKSTLARGLYEDSVRMQHFDKRVWVVVSQEYSLKEILLGVVRSIMPSIDDLSKKSISQLVELIHKELFGRRSLFVLDDVWSEKVWDDLNTIMPKNANGSCVLLTTRLSKVATYVTSTQAHELHLLSEDESWILLKHVVFGARYVPYELEIFGKEIAKECKGLPLTVVVVAGLLKGNMAKEYWESISRNVSSREPTIELLCSKVLSLSYDHLPLHLKSCFLYVTAFPEDSEIKANRLIRLWIAEGFVKSSGTKCLEEVAEEYLVDLVARNTLQVSKKRYDSRIKTVVIHDLLRDFGTLKAREMKFRYHGNLEKIFGTHDLSRDMDILQDQEESNCRRLSIHTKESLDGLRDVRYSTISSLLIFFPEEYKLLTPIPNLTMLRVLDALTTIQEINPGRLVHLRYLAFKTYKYNLLGSWFKLPDLQTLIIHDNFINTNYPPLHVPLEIWTMPSLRHLILPIRSYLEQPIFGHDTVMETNMVTLSATLRLEMHRHTTKMLLNLKKLSLRYFGAGKGDWENCQFRNIVHLGKLEELKLKFPLRLKFPYIPEIAPLQLALPLTLKKLSLFDTQRPWRDMRIVGSLPNLQVLKLRHKVATDMEWNPTNGQFLKVKYLGFRNVHLCHWGVESSHFPSLEVLFLQLMGGTRLLLEEIPSGLGEIDTLRLIQLVSCVPTLVDSALQIQAGQREMGNEYLQVDVLN